MVEKGSIALMALIVTTQLLAVAVSVVRLYLIADCAFTAIRVYFGTIIVGDK